MTTPTYLPGNRPIPAAAKLALQTGGFVLRHLVSWLISNLKKHETIDLHPWVDTLWYVVVKDERVTQYPDSSLIGFTIDVKADRIFWAHATWKRRAGFTKGGNCFCRSFRWWRLMERQYPHALSDRKFPGKGTVHDYRRRKEAVRA